MNKKKSRAVPLCTHAATNLSCQLTLTWPYASRVKGISEVMFHRSSANNSPRTNALCIIITIWGFSIYRVSSVFERCACFFCTTDVTRVHQETFLKLRCVVSSIMHPFLFLINQHQSLLMRDRLNRASENCRFFCLFDVFRRLALIAIIKPKGVYQLPRRKTS